MVGILDWSVIIIYMLSMVVVGVYFKTNDNMTDFAVADKKLDISVRRLRCLQRLSAEGL